MSNTSSINPLAYYAIIFSVLGLFCIRIFSFVGLGLWALREIGGVPYRGRTVAIVAVVLGSIGVGLYLITVYRVMTMFPSKIEVSCPPLLLLSSPLSPLSSSNPVRDCRERWRRSRRPPSRGSGRRRSA